MSALRSPDDDDDDVDGLEGLTSNPPKTLIQGPSGRVYSGRSLSLFKIADQPRRSAILLVEHRLFESVILTTIFCNVVTMGWASPLDPPGTWKAGFIGVCEWVYLAIFTGELLSKVLAYGLVRHEDAYLRDPWCQLDFVVVTLAWVPILVPSFGNFSAVRSVRALRPLRALKRVPGMPVLVNAILAALPKLGDVVLLCTFLLVVLGSLGTSTFKGVMHYRCARLGYTEPTSHPSLLPNDPHWQSFLSAGREAPNTEPAVLAAGDELDTGIFCNPLDAASCDAVAVDEGGASCAYFVPNPSSDITSFDSFGATAIIVLQALTFDEFATAMYATMDATGAPAVVAFWLFIVLFGGFFLVNLFLAVLFQEFVMAQWIEATAALRASERLARKAARRKLKYDGASMIQRVWLRHKGAGGLWLRMLRRLAEEQERQEALAAAGNAGGRNSVTDDDVESLLPPELEMSDGFGQGRSDGSWQAELCGGATEPGTLRWQVKEFVGLAQFGNAMTGLVLVNVFLMCLPFYGMPQSYADNLEAASSVITWIFILEMAAKLWALGWQDYWADGWNVLDGSIVLMSLAEIILTALLAGSGLNISFLRVLRMLRVARMLRLMKAWKGLHVIVTTIIKAIPQLYNVFILLLIIVTIFALLGMQIFGGKFTEAAGYQGYGAQVEGNVVAELTHRQLKGGANAVVSDEGGLAPLPRFHFDYFIPASLTVFIIMSGDAWFSPMLDGISVAGQSASIFYVVLVLLGTYLMMNLLVAILLQLFSQKEDVHNPLSPAPSRASSPDPHSRPSSPEPTKPSYSRPGSPGPPSLGKDGGIMLLEDDYALGCFGRDHSWRVACYELLASEWYTQLIIGTIVVSSIMLIVDNPRLEPASLGAALLLLGDLVVTLIFASEAVAKTVAYGFLVPKGAYLRSTWNALDFLLVLIGIGALLSELLPALSFMKPLRALRVLRPLRVMRRNAGMATVLSSLWDAMPAVLNVFGVLNALQVVFAIVGMQLFAGSFSACNDPSILSPELCTGVVLESGQVLSQVENRGSAEAMARGLHALAEPAAHFRRLKGGGGDGAFVGERRWQNPEFGSFDDFGQAMTLLFVMSTGDDWDKIMFHGMDSVGPGLARVRDDSSAASIFFIMWTFIGCFFAMQLFVGVVIEQFNAIRAQKDGSALMTDEQRQWVKAQQALSRIKVKLKPSKGETPLDEMLHDALLSDVARWVVTSLVFASVVVLCADTWEARPDGGYDTWRAHFTLLFLGEGLLKVRAFGWEFYSKDEWCRLELALISISVADELGLINLVGWLLWMSPLVIRFLQALQGLRAMRLLQHAQGISKLLSTVIMSLPSLANVGLLLALVVYIYSVLGVNLFTFLPRGDIFTDDRNFDHFGASLLLNFEALTGDGWSSMMSEAANDSIGAQFAATYFISFQLLCSSVILNLVVAVILENFTSLGTANDDLISGDDLQAFSDAWSHFDPTGQQCIAIEKLPHLLRRLPRPMGLKGAPMRWAVRMSLNLALSSNEAGMLGFHETLERLVDYNYKVQTGYGGQTEEPPKADTGGTGVNGGVHGGVNGVDVEATGKMAISSPLWEHGAPLPKAKAAVARVLILEMLRVSRAGANFIKCVSQATREQRTIARMQIRAQLRKEHDAAAMNLRQARDALDATAGATSLIKGHGKSNWALAAAKAINASEKEKEKSAAIDAAEKQKAEILEIYSEIEQKSKAIDEAFEAVEKALSPTKLSSTKLVNEPVSQAVVASPPAATAEKPQIVKSTPQIAPDRPRSPQIVKSTPEAPSSTLPQPPPEAVEMAPRPDSPHSPSLYAEASAALDNAHAMAALSRINVPLQAAGVPDGVQASSSFIQGLAEAMPVQTPASPTRELTAEAAAVGASRPTDSSLQVRLERLGERLGEEVQLARERLGERSANMARAAAASVVPAAIAVASPLAGVISDTIHLASETLERRHPRASTDDPHGFFDSPIVPLESLIMPLEAGALSFRGNIVHLGLHGTLDQFTPEVERELLRRLAAYGGLGPSQLVVLGKKAGSILLQIGVLEGTKTAGGAAQLLRTLGRVTVERLTAVLGCEVLSVSVAYANDGHAPGAAHNAAPSAASATASAARSVMRSVAPSAVSPARARRPSDISTSSSPTATGAPVASFPSKAPATTEADDRDAPGRRRTLAVVDPLSDRLSDHSPLRPPAALLTLSSAADDDDFLSRLALAETHDRSRHQEAGQLSGQGTSPPKPSSSQPSPSNSPLKRQHGTSPDQRRRRPRSKTPPPHGSHSPASHHSHISPSRQQLSAAHATTAPRSPSGRPSRR